MRSFFKNWLVPLLTITLVPIFLINLITYNRLNEHATLIGYFKFLINQPSRDLVINCLPSTYGLATYGIFVIFQFLIVIPGKRLYGEPSVQDGYAPSYRNNGLLCFLITMVSWAVLAFYHPNLIMATINRFDEIQAAANLFSLTIGLLLLIKSKIWPNSSVKSTGNLMKDFMTGCEEFPTFFGIIDIKWFCFHRLALMSWPILVASNWFLSFKTFGFRLDLAVSAILSLLSALKIYALNPIHNVQGRAGFFIISMTFMMPSFSAFPTQYLAFHKPTNGHYLENAICTFALISGIFFLITQIMTEKDREIVRSSKGEKSIFGTKPKVIKAIYRREFDKREFETYLVVSGFWGISQHYTYLAEICLTFSWSLVAGFDSILPYLHFILLLPLLAGRKLIF